MQYIYMHIGMEIDHDLHTFITLNHFIQSMYVHVGTSEAQHCWARTVESGERDSSQSDKPFVTIIIILIIIPMCEGHFLAATHL